jgi:DNA-binding NtrC family response regulator
MYVPVGTTPRAFEVRNALEGLGYGVFTSELAEDTFRGGVQRQGPLVMLVGRPPLPRDRLLSLLSSADSPAAFSIFDDHESCVDAEIASCCDEFACWPCGRSELAVRVERICGRFGVFPESIDESTLASEFLKYNLIGNSPTFLEVLRRIRKVADCDAPVLIEGETGTGKELTARAIHYLGRRKDHPFIPVNCGALPDSLLENEFFGHERGAYTDARVAFQGAIARARGGTLFLDEIDSLSARGQVILLRFLQDGHFMPLGGNRLECADVRVVAASNCRVADLVERRAFRQDLLFRLNVLAIEIPPLRERHDDALLLAKHFLASHQASRAAKRKVLHPSMQRFLRTHSWPGNVRELENFVYRELLLSENDELVAPTVTAPKAERRRGLSDRRNLLVVGDEMRAAKRKAIESFERNYIQAILAESNGNVSRAARNAGKERRAFGRLLKKYTIRSDDYR